MEQGEGVLGALMLNKPWFWHNQALLLCLANTAKELINDNSYGQIATVPALA
jgi:hypothetical protein